MANTKIPIELSSTPSISDSGNATAITIDSSEKTTFSGDVEVGTTAPKINLKNTDTSIVADQSLGVIEVESSDGSTGSAGTIAKLDIAASGAFDGSGHGSDFRFSVGATNQSGSIALSEVMRISSTGKTSFSANGIGSTATQDRDFTFYSEGSTNGVDIRSNDYRLALIGAGGSSGSAMDKGYMALYNEGTNTIAFNTNGDSYFNGNGGVAIGTTSVDNTTKLTVVQPNNDYPVARFDMSGAVNAIVGQEIRVTNAAANAANKFFIRGLDDTSTERFRFNTNGSGSMSGSLSQNSSDKRLKKEITTIENPLEKLKTLRGVNFTWKDKTPVGDLDLPNPNTKDVGVIAQEVQSVLPEAVELAPLDSKIDENGNKVSITGENYLTVFEEKIVPLLIESIKEQQTIIEDLKARIETLEG